MMILDSLWIYELFHFSGVGDTIHPQTLSGIKKSLVLEPGTSKFSIRTSIYFHPMSDGQVRIYSARLYYLECPVLFGNRASKNLGVLVRRTSDHFEIFLPLTLFMAGICDASHQFNNIFYFFFSFYKYFISVKNLLVTLLMAGNLGYLMAVISSICLLFFHWFKQYLMESGE